MEPDNGMQACDYCYARPIANRFYRKKFEPDFYPERLSAPANTKVPEEAKNNPVLKRVFVGSMGDIFGNWVPDELIRQVFASCIANPQWEYLFLTKFPQRYVELLDRGVKLPPTA